MKKFLDISDINKDDLSLILQYATELEKKREKPLSNLNIGMLFENYSTRTRLSFHVAINELGGEPVKLDFSEMNIQRVESFEDTFEILNCYLDMIVYRTTDHKRLDIAQKYFKKPIINALSNLSHPCQAVSDIFTLKEHFKNLEGLTISWFGDMNNVLYSLCQVLELLGNMKLNIFTHKDISERNKQRFNFKFTNIYHKIEKSIISNSDCIMTDVYSSMNDGKNDNASLLKPFRVDEELMSYTNKEAIFMHCLPANIDSEVTLAVLKSNKSITLKQAYNRLVAQRGILKWLVS